MGDRKIMLVTTINGELLPRSQCRFIRKKFYKTGKVNIFGSGDCFRVTDSKGITKYRTLEAGTVVWDSENNKYVHKSMLNTIEAITDKFGKIEYIPKTNNLVILIDNNKKTYCINEKIANELGYAERLYDGFYYKKQDFPDRFFTEKLVPDTNYKVSLNYGCDNLMPTAIKNYNKEYSFIDNTSTIIENIYAINPNIFEKYTFGLEFETTHGIIPNHICKRLGLMPLRDGSISGIEYASIPLNGKKGLYTILDIYNEIQKRTLFDFTCSMHIHIGGLERKNSTILALFKALFLLQNDIYDYFPMYKYKNHGIKRKNYTSPLSDILFAKMNYKNRNEETIKEDISELIYYLSGNAYGFDQMPLEKITKHPNNPGNDRKWGMSARYLWFNLIPIVFTNKKTVEFRIFGMPNTEMKIFSFLAMALSLAEFISKNEKAILKDPDIIQSYDLRRIVRYIFPLDFLDRFLMRRRMKVGELSRLKGLNYTEKDI